MFRTMREAELMPRLVRPTNGLQFWSLVELETVWPWFHVETIESRGTDQHQGIVLASNVQLLKDLIHAGVENAWVSQIQIITPDYMNGTSSWKMEILESLHEITDSNGQICGHEYRVPTGKTYSTVTDKSINLYRERVYDIIENQLARV